MQEVYNQLFCLLMFTLTGMSIGMLFDIFRILRKSFKTADWITYLQDVIFWILAGGIMLFSIFVFNNGEIRSYIFIGLILGVILYMLAISRFFVKISVTIIQFIKKILSYPIHLVELIIRKAIIQPVVFFLKKGRGVVNSTSKKIHKFTKIKRNPNRKHKKMKEKEGILQKM